MRVMAIFVMIWTCLAGGAALAEARTITVVGQGQVQEAPDQAVIVVGASHQADTAEQALSQANHAVAEMIEVLEASGIDGRDMQTSGLGLRPVYDHNRKDNQRPLLVGFTASNRLTVKVRDIASVGAVLSDLVAAGANDISSVSFGLSDPERTQDAARRDAVADARAKATLYAEAAGVSLGKVVSISEAGATMPRPEMMRTAMASMDAVPIAAGELTVSAQVQMVLELTD